jgi:hypothetical protein
MCLVEQLHGILSRVLHQGYGTRGSIGCLTRYISFRLIFFLMLNDKPGIALKLSLQRLLVENPTRGWLKTEFVQLLQS